MIVNSNSDLHGILPAVVTPLDPEGRLCTGAFERLLAHLYSAGVDGIFACGQTGEGLLLPVAEGMRVAEVAVRCSPPGRAIVQVGAHSTAETVCLARHARDIGAAAIATLPPTGMYSFSEVRDFYRAVAAVSDLPVLVYVFPKAFPSLDSPVQVLELCHIPNVIGLKFTHMDLFALSCLKSEGLKVFNGHDEVLLAGLLMGADGGIGSFYNLVPDLFVQLYRLARSQRWQEARSVQAQINELIRITSRFPLIPAVKLMLRWFGLECGNCIPPRRPMTEEEEARLCGELKRTVFAERLLM